jgi:lysophospholipase L1-like esterase
LLPTGYVVVNLGASGETAHQIAARVLEGAATACVGEPCGTYVLEGGVNTLKSATYAASAAETVAAVALEGDGGSDGADDRGMIDAADFLRATYPTAQVLLVGVLPYAGCDVATCPSLVQPAARASAYNTALLTACASRPWLTCILPYAALEDPSQPDYLLPAYACADGIHLVNAGSAALAASIYSTGSW